MCVCACLVCRFGVCCCNVVGVFGFVGLCMLFACVCVNLGVLFQWLFVFCVCGVVFGFASVGVVGACVWVWFR